MWKVLLLAALCAFNVHADRVGNTDEMGGDEGMDAEEYAVTPGNPQEGDDPVTGEKNDQAACLSADTVKRYSGKARAAGVKVKEFAAKAKRADVALRNVRLALEATSLIPRNSGPLALKSIDAGPALKKHKFINLLECKDWRDKIKGGSGEIPLGAVLIYSGGSNGDARIKTPEGCIGPTPKDTRCTSSHRKLVGVYVKVMN
jgi:hypothetical protein